MIRAATTPWANDSREMLTLTLLLSRYPDFAEVFELAAIALQYNRALHSLVIVGNRPPFKHTVATASSFPEFWQVGSQKGTGVDRLMRGMMCRSKIPATSPDGDVAMANTRWGKAPSEISERKIAYNRGKFKRADREPWLSLAAVRSECGGPAY